MKKSIKNILKIIIVSLLIVALSIPMFGCNNNTEDKKTVDPNHNFSYTETSNYVLKNGATDYSIVVPAGEISTEIVNARDELIRIFKEATGVTLNAITDAGIIHNANNKYISLGDTTLFSTSGLTVDKNSLTKDGIRILTKDNTIFIVGGSDTGVLYGVYDFLNMHFDFETYYIDCYDLKTGVKELKLMNYNVTDIPDIAYREQLGITVATTSNINDMMFTYRMRTIDKYGSLFLPIHSGSTKDSTWRQDHNSFYYLPKSDYEESHPKFYSTDGKQLCFTAHGDEEELEEMIDICAKKVEQSLMWYTKDKYPNYIMAQFGINDMADLCNCESCQQCAKNHNGAKSASLIKFLNKLGEKVNEWMNKSENAEYKREDFGYAFLAYADTLQTPFRDYVTYTWNYNEDLRSPDGVKIVPYVAQDKFKYSESLYSTGNKLVRQYVIDWAKEYGGCMAWSYGTFFKDYLCFYDNFGFYSEYYKFLKENNYWFTFPEIHECQRGADTGFGVLFHYLYSKLAWNSSLDATTLINNYFNSMYKDAAPIMQELFREEKLWFQSENVNGSMITGTSITTNVSKLPYGTVNCFLTTLNMAYAKIESYKRDIVTYNRLKNYIDMEWIFPAKAMLSLHKSKYTTQAYEDLKEQFKTIAHNLNLAVIKEVWLYESPTTIDEFLNSLA